MSEKIVQKKGDIFDGLKIDEKEGDIFAGSKNLIQRRAFLDLRSITDGYTKGIFKEFS